MKNNLPSILLVVGFILFFSPMLYTSAGFVPATIITVSMIGGLVLWIKFPLDYPTEPKKILPIYALMVASLWFHISEELAFDFGSRLGIIIHSGWTDKEFLFSFGYFMPVLWILGLIGLAYFIPLATTWHLLLLLACFLESLHTWWFSQSWRVVVIIISPACGRHFYRWYLESGHYKP